MNLIPTNTGWGIVKNAFDYGLRIWSRWLSLAEDGNPFSIQSLVAILGFAATKIARVGVSARMLSRLLASGAFFAYVVCEGLVMPAATVQFGLNVALRSILAAEIVLGLSWMGLTQSK